ncbi:hypothetical protein SODALDRAFT_333513 [Sodiomyces alkalinus F11]|uniref:Infection structure specific protein n=1 Tax=Sodiomyces alkalinus (strain CBS 110278 / VKM F-3762 / F11) TaxID=1314773 RepID=A0A3N2PTE2_SODAK|nr:hypothetical protein SODALDRAFT_333513 [Sodiomyces alkalinus F11]ROT37758.1 hypothetical protein SODALDRAFT_333513 [Sodiomyces alkalinus F11]
MYAQAAFLITALVAGVAAQAEPTPTQAYDPDACQSAFESIPTLFEDELVVLPEDDDLRDLATSYMLGEFYNTADTCELPAVTDVALAGPFSEWASSYTSFVERHYTVYRSIWEGCWGEPMLELSYPVAHYCSDLALAITGGVGDSEPTAAPSEIPSETPTPAPTGTDSEDEEEDNNGDDGEDAGESDNGNGDDGSAANRGTVASILATGIVALACIAAAY